MLNVKQESCENQFLSHWFDPTRNRTPSLPIQKQTLYTTRLYLGLTISSDGRCEEEVRRMIQAGWMGWKKISGVVCDRKLSAKIKGKMYQSVIRLANGHA